MASATKKTNKHRDHKKAKLVKARAKKVARKKRAGAKKGVINK
jgi:hypothetical protein